MGVHRAFKILDGRSAVALIVLLVAAVPAGSLAGLARTRTWEALRRRRDADLAADMARLLLGGAG